MKISSLFACALLVAACGGKKDDKPSGGDDKPTKAVEKKPLSKIEGGKITGIYGDDIAMLPTDSDLIGGINLEQLQMGSLWKTMVQPMIAKKQGDLDTFKTKCGFDPSTAIKVATFGLKNVDISTTPDVVAVLHGLDKKQINDCFGKMKDEAAKDGTNITVDGDFTSIVHGDKTIAIMWKDDAVLVQGPHGSKDDLTKLAKGDDTLRGSPQVVAMYGKINAQDSLWFLLKGSAKIVERAQAVQLAPIAVFGTVNAGDSITTDIRLRAASAAEATQMLEKVKPLAGMAMSQAPIDKLDATQDDVDVRLQGLMSAANVQKLQQMQSGGGAPPAQGSATP